MAFRRGVEQRYLLQEGLGSLSLVPLRVEQLNALALSAWDDRPFLYPVTRGVPLAGGLARWREEVSRRLQAPGVELEEEVRSGLLGQPC